MSGRSDDGDVESKLLESAGKAGGLAIRIVAAEVVVDFRVCLERTQTTTPILDQRGGLGVGR